MKPEAGASAVSRSKMDNVDSSIKEPQGQQVQEVQEMKQGQHSLPALEATEATTHSFESIRWLENKLLSSSP